MKSEDAAKTSRYTGPINVMTLREVSATRSLMVFRCRQARKERITDCS